MEDSAKRRERLQAMRMEASSAAVEGPSPSFSSTSSPLSNPLTHPSVPTSESSPPLHRFDYYTDPAAAYSTVKRKPGDNSGGGGNGGYFHPPKFSSPISAPRPIAGQMDYHMLSNYNYHTPQFTSPNPSLYDTPLARSHSDSRKSPAQYHSSASRNNGTHNFPRPQNTSGSSGHSNFSASSKGCPLSSRHGESPMSSAYKSSSPSSPHWQFRGGSPSPGRSGGRGRGGYFNKGFGRPHYDNFNVKYMVKDPWRKLKPVVGNILVPLSGPQFFLPKSIAAKKVKVAETAVDIINPKQNLAEILASAFEETVRSEDEKEGSVL